MQNDIDVPYVLRPRLFELEALHGLLSTGKTTAAADLLGVSQPAISRAIAGLERKIGKPLFSRDGGRLVPTSHAFALDADASPIFATLNRLKAWPENGSLGENLKLMAPPTIAHVVLAPLVARYCRAYPEIRINVEVGRAADVVNAVADSSADLGIVDIELAHAGIRSEVLLRRPAEVLMPKDHPLASLEMLTPALLDKIPLIAVTKRFSARARLERAFAEAGITPQIVIEAGTLEFVVEMVRAGIGVAVVNPFPTSFVGTDEFVLRPFTPMINHEVLLLFPASSASNVAAERFSNFVRTQHGIVLAGQPVDEGANDAALTRSALR